MMKYFIKLAFSFLFLIAPSFASCHVSDCDDQDFIELGKKYPCVGSFSCSNGIFGSGTLVDLDVPELKDRIVITCAHIFVDQEEGSLQDIKFTIGDNPPGTGTFTIHPTFQDFYRQHGVPAHTSFDIGIFILDEPAHNITPASLDLNMTYEDLLDKDIISVGFGATGHVLGKYQIIDPQKRASYARARSQDNPNEEKEQKHWLGMDESGAPINPFSFTEKRDSILRLTPYVSSPWINQQNSLEVFLKPAGVARQGDSGGGCFECASGRLIGVISGGDCPRKPVEVVFEKNYFTTYQEGLKKCIEGGQTAYQKALDDLKSDPEKLEDFLQQNATPKEPSIIEAKDIMSFIKDQYAIEAFYSNDIHQKADMEIVTIFFHRDWIMETINSMTSSNSGSRR